MIRELLTHLHWTYLPVLTMSLFMAVFFGAWLWVYRKGSSEIYAEVGRYPLDDSQEGGKK